MLLVLLGCGALATPDGEERVRGGLWLEGAFANSPGTVVALVANSPVPCEPAVVDDDPRTKADEAASAEAWWEAELGAALNREGAALLLLVLSGAGETEDFEVGGPLSLNGSVGTGSAVAIRVVEAAVEESTEALHAWVPTEVEVDERLHGEAHVRPDAGVVGLTLDLGEWGATTELERCDNVDLVPRAVAGVEAAGAGALPE